MREIDVKVLTVQRLPNKPGLMGHIRYRVVTERGTFRTVPGLYVPFGSVSRVPVKVDRVCRIELTHFRKRVSSLVEIDDEGLPVHPAKWPWVHTRAD